MKEIRHLKTIKNKRNLNTKWLLLQNDQNADTTLLHSHDELFSFLEIKFQNGAHLKKGLFLTYFSHFLVTREKLQKFLQRISHSHT